MSPDGPSCDALNANAASDSGSCAARGSSCVCTDSARPLAQSGSYTLLDANLLANNVEEPYCVTGDTLALPIQVGNFLTAGSFEKQ